MPSVEWNNQAWDQTHGWASDGDEWSGLAAHCGQPYEAWKQALIDTFMLPNIGPETDVLEIAPGHGRWTQTLIPNARSVTLVDLSASCIEVCQERFADATNVTYHVNDGRSLAMVPDRSIDFVWSFDSFVHIEIDVIDAYLAEWARVLRPGGRFVVHHADKRNWSLSLVPVTRKLGQVGRVVQRVASQGRLRDSGNRSNVSAELMASTAEKHGFRIDRQTDRWGPSGEFTVTKYRDTITAATLPR
jgi:ubiquinone/menaquinone biosynthesis C-methylase UbiE